MTDNVIIKRIKNGDDAAFEYIYNKYRDKVYKYIFYKITFEADVEDLLQDTFTLVYKNINLYDKSKGSFYNFILANANRVVISYVRKKNRRKDKFESNLMRFIKDDETTVDEDFEKNEEIDALSKMISNLSDTHKTAINLVYVRNLSYKDAARIMGKTESSFKSILFRARNALKENMLREYPEMSKRFKANRIIKMCLVLCTCVTMLSGLVYATIRICSEVFKKPTYTLSELREDVPDENAIVSREEALEKIRHYLQVLGNNDEITSDDLHLVKDFKLNEICWMAKNEKYLIEINSKDSSLAIYNDFTNEIDILNKKSIEELYTELGLPDEYDLYKEENLDGSQRYVYAKKYGDIWNEYQSVSVLIIDNCISSIYSIDYPYEDKEVLVSKDEAIEILKKNNFEVTDIELSIEILRSTEYSYTGYEEIVPDNSVENEEIFVTNLDVRKVWNYDDIVFVDSNTGEIILNIENNSSEKKIE